MKVIKFILLKLYMVWTILVFSVFMLVYLPFILIPFLFGSKGGAISYLFLKIWSGTFSVFNMIRYKIVGRENIDRNKAYIYVCNHTSYLDVPGISLTIPTQYRPLAKKELKRIPVFGWIAQYACVIIDRSSKQSKKDSIVRLKKILNANISILIFPEGTQNRSAEIVKPFYDGAFRIAIETGVPILPITTLNAGKLMPPHKIHIEPGTIKIIVGNEIKTKGLSRKHIPMLKEKVRNLMISMIQKNTLPQKEKHQNNL